MNDPDVTLKTGDTLPAVTVSVIDAEGEPVDLTGASTEFRMIDRDTGNVAIEKQALVDDASAGRVAYQWDESDTTTPGMYRAEFCIDYDGGSGDSFDSDETVPANSRRSYITIEIIETLG